MKKIVEKSDFVLTPYMQSNDWRAIYQVLNTLIPYVLLWVLAVKAVSISIWLLLLIIPLLVLFSLRCFSLMHDCGHYSLFRSKKVNRIVGFIFGLVNAMPQYWWSRDHAYHHKTNGDWERYRGIGDFLSTKEYAELTPSDQKLYGVLRHPLMAFPGGFFYLAFKPRIIFILGVYDFIRHSLSCFRADPKTDFSAIIASHQPKHWSTAAEFWDILLNNIFVVGGWILFSHWLGAGFFLGIYSVVLTLSAAIFINVFFVQHNFDGAYAHKTEGWDYLAGAIEGSSYLELPWILKWFTADISYHNIHHLSERIPNYNLQACHQENAHLLTQARTIRMGEILDCAKFILWDSDENKLVSIQSFQRSQANAFS
ncbi:MAG: fatty acid desaturase [Leptolyngbyaceae cyanobacterium MAG.088]|nr:fatty acid desaturase [Leptolyngbyaceae cyanobacterium MAG.088]